ENATVSISEIMYTPGRGMPQWIELYNSATTQAVNLKDWELQLESAAGADVRNITLTLKANILIQPNQPLLLVSAKTESDQHSGHFPPSRLINLWGLYRSELAVIDVGRQYTLLSPNAFRLTLREK
ncbi:MAG: lamin tail domain-containing protein, partial [Aphanocapsa feldmannii 277cV]